MGALKSDTYEFLNQQDNDQLYKHLTESESSIAKKIAEDILEKRRMKPLVEAAKKSADSAKCSAIAAIVSAVIALASLFVFLSKP